MKKLVTKDLTPRELEEIKYFNQDFKEITHISELVNTDFNYNEFELSVSIKKDKEK